MDTNFDEMVQERAVLVGLNADCFTKAQTATDETLEELEALLETAGGFHNVHEAKRLQVLGRHDVLVVDCQFHARLPVAHVVCAAAELEA